MDTRIPTPPMTSHKAVAAGIASLAVTVALSFLGWIPTSEDVLFADLQSLGEQLLAWATIAVVPGAVAYWKRNWQLPASSEDSP
jgi:hypothetical protein